LERAKIDAVPSHVQAERHDCRSVALGIKTELAGVLRASFRPNGLTR
jgi:hypothetical protein